MSEELVFVEDYDTSSLLIDQIQNYAFLYNLGHKDYKNAQKKRDAWADIAAALNVPVKECMKVWKTIRDKYTRERRDGIKSGTSAETRWPLYSKMCFFETYYRPRKTCINVQTVGNLQDYSDASSSTASSVMSPELQDSSLDATVSAETSRNVKKRTISTEEAERVATSKSLAVGLMAPSRKNRSFADHLCCLLDDMTENEAAVKRQQLITCFFPK